MTSLRVWLFRAGFCAVAIESVVVNSIVVALVLIAVTIVYVGDRP